MTSPHEQARAAATAAIQEVHFDSYGLTREIAEAAITAYLAALPAPDLADGVVAELADIANDEDLGPATTDVRSALERAASALRSLSAKLTAVERERDTLTERLAEMEAGRPDDCETIVDRLRSLAIRREQEGIYTDAAIAERAAEIIEGVGAMSMSVDLSANDGQPAEQQEWHDYDPDC